MTNGSVLYHRHDSIVTLTLNRPETLNAMNEAMMAEIERILIELEADTAVRAVVLTGAGRAFSSGGDQKRSGESPPSFFEGDLGGALIERLNRCILRMQRLPKPIVGSINGVAAGAGLNIALATDLRIAADTARFGEVFARVGLVPDGGGTYFLPRLVGTAKAMEMILLADIIDAQEALRIGLVNRVVPAEQLEPETLKLAERLAQGPTVAYGLAKTGLYQGLGMSLEDVLNMEARNQAIAARTPDRAEGVGRLPREAAAAFHGACRRVKPRRSVLFMPGSNARALEKGRVLPADVLVLDLEDAVAPEMKLEARAQVAAAVRAGGYGHREIVVRVNALSTPWGRDDLAAAAAAGADAVLLPKVEAAETVSAAIATLGPAPAVWCMLETPRGILNAPSIAAASPRVSALVMGTSDLTKDLHARVTRERLPLLTTLQLCVLAARSAGITALDGVHLDLDDDAGFVAACRQAADFGFDGKTLIHPKQVALANEVFAPAASDVDWARRVIAAHADALARGRGVAVLDGRLIENLHVDDARRVLALADAITERAKF